MLNGKLENTIRVRRDRLGLSQQALAEVVGVSRQAIVAIEAGRQVPSTHLALQLARVLGCSVEDLFRLSAGSGLNARIALEQAGVGIEANRGSRVAIGWVDGRWVAHRLSADATLAADGVIGEEIGGSNARVHPFSGEEALTRNVLVAGCAPLLGALARRVGARFHDATVTWLTAGSRRSLDLLDAKLIHVAGVHLGDPEDGQDNESTVRAAFPGERMLLVNLTRWRQGFVVAPGNPKEIRSAEDLLRPGLRFATREAGAGAAKLVKRLLSQAGAEGMDLEGPMSLCHEDVARYVHCGVADFGVAIEGVALAAGLGFVPLAEERFDLVVPATLAATAPVSRILEALDDPSFRIEMMHLPGYDGSTCGHVTTLEAA